MKTLSILITICVALLFAGAARAGEAPAGKTAGLRVVHVGNSHSHALRFLEPLARAVGHAGHKDGEINILGSPLRWNWDHPQQNKWQETLAADKLWDAITLLAWAGDDDVYAPRFTAEALKGNPKCQVLIYTIWPDAAMNWNNPQPIRTEAHTEKVAAAVEKAFRNAPKPRVIPSSLLIRELGRLADAGQLPGVANRFELFSDGGHLSKLGMYAVDVLVCAMLYNESPLNYPASYDRKDARGNIISGWYESLEVPEPAARIVRQTAWDILLTYPPAGLSTSLVIADRHLPPAIMGQPYSEKLKSLNAQGLCKWSIVQGQLPQGLILSAEGAITGQSQAAGEHALIVRVEDGKGAFQRPLSLRVSEDKPPVLAHTDLKPIGLDQYVFHAMKVQGGVGTVKWELADGKLPFGVQLAPAGVLVGTPGEAGKFRFTVRAADSHPAGGRSATQSLIWSIAPTSPQSLLVKSIKPAAGAKSSDLVKVDGRLDEPFWNLDQPIARKVQGTPRKQASFGAVWLDEGKGNGQALYVAVKVMDGPAGKTPKEAIHIYLDGRHNHEVIYNADDLHVIIPRQGKPEFVRSHTPWWFMESAVMEMPDGYVVEMKIGSAYFLGKGIAIPFGRYGVYGFDIAVDEGDGQIGRQTWRGNERNDEDTSAFGTIVLSDGTKD